MMKNVTPPILKTFKYWQTITRETKQCAIPSVLATVVKFHYVLSLKTYSSDELITTG